MAGHLDPARPHRRFLACAAGALAVVTLASACGGGKTVAPSPRATAPVPRFVTRPDLRPPRVTVLTPARGTAPGLVFIAPKQNVEQAGPLILDDHGQVVWFKPLPGKGITDFKVQTFHGRPVLTWWRGSSKRGVGRGSYVIADDHYRTIATVRAGNGLSGDIHEFVITPRNTAVFTVYHGFPKDLSRWGGPKRAKLQEGVVQEVDIATGKVLFEWHSAAHVSPSDSSEEPPTKAGDNWDYFHVNSIEPDGDAFVVSSRHTQAIYKIRRSDGRILWRLGGKRGDFEMGPGTRFSWQHDARLQPDGTLTLFDSAASRPKQAKQSKVLVLRLDEKRRTATLVHAYAHPAPLLSTTQGDAQVLADGHVLVGWGSNPY